MASSKTNTTTYHLKDDGSFGPCEATMRTCPKGPQNHIILDGNINSLDDLWVAFKNAKEGKTKTVSLDVESLSPDALDEIASNIFTEKTTVEEQKEKAEKLLKDSNYDSNVLYAMKMTKLYTKEELDKYFFQAPKERATRLIPVVFGDDKIEGQRTDEDYQKYAIYATAALEAKTEEGKPVKTKPYYFRQLLEEVSKNAEKDETIKAYLPVIETMELYTDRYNEPQTYKFLENKNITAETAERIMSTIIRSGDTNNFFEAAVVLKSRLNNVKPDNDFREQVHQEMQSIPETPAYNGESEQFIQDSAGKTLAEAAKGRKHFGISYEIASNAGVMAVHDSYAATNQKLKDDLKAARVAHKKTRKDINDSIYSHALIVSLETRLRESVKYRKSVEYYWTLISQLREKGAL